MPLRNLQSQLEDIYEVQCEYDVRDFLVTDPEFARRMDRGPDARDVDEKLLLVQDGESVDLALYLDRDLLARMLEHNPVTRLHSGNIIDFWIVLEGVSHFIYVAWSAARERRVTLLELEMQAEVDKYVSALFTFGQQQNGQFPDKLHQSLFDAPTFDQALSRIALERYKNANRYAAKYCLGLESRYLRRARIEHLLSDLRRFYRMPQGEKIRHIDSMHTSI